MGVLHPIPSAIFALALATVASSVAAHEGEDHGKPEGPAAAASLGADRPRASSATEVFETVAVLQPGQVLFYIDTYDANVPVAGAAVDVDGKTIKGRAKELAPGVYALPVRGLSPGAHVLTLTVATAETVDLQALSLEIPPAEVAASPEAGNASVVVVLLALLLAATGAAGRHFLRRRETNT